MAKSYRLISAAPEEVNRQLLELSNNNRQAASNAQQKPILMSSVIAPAGGGRAHVTLYVVIEVDQP